MMWHPKILFDSFVQFLLQILNALVHTVSNGAQFGQVIRIDLFVPFLSYVVDAPMISEAIEENPKFMHGLAPADAEISSHFLLRCQPSFFCLGAICFADCACS